MLIERLSTLALGISAVLALSVAEPVVAQSSYTSPPPRPGSLSESGNNPERLAADDEAIVYGSWDFTYASTPDDNLFVTRIFIADFGRDTVGATIQVDCGQLMFRHVVTPRIFEDRAGDGVPMRSIAVNSWRYVDENMAMGRALMRTCEAAAQESGIEWVWY